MNPDDTLIMPSIKPYRPINTQLPIPGKHFKFLKFKRPPPFFINARLTKVSPKSKEADVYRVKIKFKRSTVKKVVMFLKDRHGGIVPDPKPVVSIIKRCRFNFII